MKDQQLVKAAFKLAQAADKMADDNLPAKLAEIVKLHAKIAVGAAVLPIPGADIAATATNIWTMYARINKGLDLPFSENLVKSVAAGFVTNLGVGLIAFLVAASAVKMIPGLGWLGGAALLAGTIYGLTIAAGIVYMNAIARLLEKKSASSIAEQDVKDAVKEEMKDQDALKATIEAAREDYKTEPK